MENCLLLTSLENIAGDITHEATTRSILLHLVQSHAKKYILWLAEGRCRPVHVRVIERMVISVKLRDWLRPGLCLADWNWKTEICLSLFEGKLWLLTSEVWRTPFYYTNWRVIWLVSPSRDKFNDQLTLLRVNADKVSKVDAPETVDSFAQVLTGVNFINISYNQLFVSGSKPFPANVNRFAIFLPVNNRRRIRLDRTL
jgi:hypothetical protein